MTHGLLSYPTFLAASAHTCCAIKQADRRQDGPQKVLVRLLRLLVGRQTAGEVGGRAGVT